MKRCLAILMSIVLVVGLLPMLAFAEVQAASIDVQSAELTDVSNGQYAPYDTVRRFYTRPLVLEPNGGEANVDDTFRTPPLDLQNPIYDDADFAVRYTGAQPYLAFSNDKHKGWTNLYNATCVAEDAATGEKVALFSRESIKDKWEHGGGGDPERLVDDKETGGKKPSGVSYECQWMFVCVSGNKATDPSLEECHLIEVVALGGAERINPTSGSYQEKTGLSRTEIAQEMKAGYNMAGHFESHWDPGKRTIDGTWGRGDLFEEAHWARGTYITRETIQNLKGQGFNAIRLPVTWYQHIYAIDDPNGAKGDPATRTDLAPTERYHIDRAWLERVHEVVDWCVAEDMYVIVNIHHEDWIDRQDLDTAYDDPAADLPAKFAAVWTQIANELSGYDQHLVFEDMNEPHMWFYNADGSTNWGFATEGSVETVNRLNADFVELMRGMPAESGHQDRLLMMAHDTGNGDISAANFRMPEDEKDLLAHSLHCYSPHDWTHYFANGNHKGETGEANVYTESYRKEVEAKWENYRTRYIANGETIILGEFGCYYLGGSAERQQDRLDWMTQYATHAKELGIPMFYWRMDRIETDADGDEHVIWSAFDEVNQQISSQSSEMFAKWFEILGDNSVEWGSLAEVDASEHASLDEGMQLLCGSEWPQTITGNHKKVDDVDAWRVICSYRADAGASEGKVRLAWSDIDGREIAVKFTGSTPRLGMQNEAYGGDTWGTSPDSVDYTNGIAYFSAESLKARWNAVVAKGTDSRLNGNTEENISRIIVCTATSGMSAPADEVMTTIVQQVAIVPVTSRVVQEPTCTTPGKKTLGGSGKTTIIPALGHSWDAGKVTTKSTTTKTGVFTYTCEREGCGHTRTESIAKLIDISKATVTLSATALTYNGKALKNPTVKKAVLGKKTLSSKTDYTVTNVTKSPKAVGTYKITVRGKGLYGGSKTLAFKINPKGTKLASVKAGKRQLTAKWAKQATQTTGYQLQYATKSNFKSGVKTVAIANPKTLSRTVKSLKGGQKYWVHVRTYKKIGKTTYYSSWSAAKAITVKK